VRQNNRVAATQRLTAWRGGLATRVSSVEKRPHSAALDQSPRVTFAVTPMTKNKIAEIINIPRRPDIRFTLQMKATVHK
jgi:hypothetical protein